MLDLNDEAAKIDIDGYFVLRLYVVVIVVNETVYKFFFESFKELFIKLQRGDAFI